MKFERLWPVLLTVAAACKSVPESRVGVAAIRFEGVHEVSKSALEDHIATTETPKFLFFFRASWKRYEDFAPEVLQKDLERIEHYYQRRGYYGTEVRAGRIFSMGKYVDVEILVAEGAPVHVHSITVQGLEREPRRIGRYAKEAVATEEGDVFDEEKLEQSTKDIGAALASLGYAYAKVTPRAVVDLGPRTADLTFQIEPGIVCQVGPLTFDGLGDLPESIVRRAFGVETGDPYASDELEAGRKAMVDLGVFASVDVVPDLSDKNRAEVPVKVIVTPSSMHGFRLGGGLQIDFTRFDVHALLGWEHRNLFGGMRHFTVEERPALVFFPTSLSVVKFPSRILPANTISATFSQPSFPEARTTTTVHAQFSSYPIILPPVNPDPDILPGYHELRTSIGPDRDFPSIKLRAGVAYNFQANFPFTYLGHFDPTAGVDSVIASYIDLHGAFDLRDDPVNTRQGFLLQSSLQFAGGILGGDAQDIRFRPEVRMFVPLGGDVVLAGRGVLGLDFTNSYGDFLGTDFTKLNNQDAAAYTRDLQLTYFRGFFSGGADSNRGYGYRAIGPHGVNPLVVAGNTDTVKANCTMGSMYYTEATCLTATGGLSLWEASAEVRIPIVGALGTVLFVDASDVAPHVAEIRLNAPHLSVGFGIRYATPVGPVRLDVGFRIPKLQTPPVEKTPENPEGKPDPFLYGPEPPKLFGVIPAALAIGIGEAY